MITEDASVIKDLEEFAEQLPPNQRAGAYKIAMNIYIHGINKGIPYGVSVSHGQTPRNDGINLQAYFLRKIAEAEKAR